MSCRNKDHNHHHSNCDHTAKNNAVKCADFSEVKEQLKALKQTIEMAVEEDPEYHADAAPLLEIVEDLKNKINDYQTRGKSHIKTEIEIMITIMGLLEFLHEVGIIDDMDDEFEEEFGDHDGDDELEDFDFEDEDELEGFDDEEELAEWDEDEESPKRR